MPRLRRRPADQRRTDHALRSGGDEDAQEAPASSPFSIALPTLLNRTLADQPPGHQPLAARPRQQTTRCAQAVDR